MGVRAHPTRPDGAARSKANPSNLCYNLAQHLAGHPAVILGSHVAPHAFDKLGCGITRRPVRPFRNGSGVTKETLIITNTPLINIGPGGAVEHLSATTPRRRNAFTSPKPPTSRTN